MYCNTCHYNFCWTCGFESNGWFHKLQIDTNETGALCVLVNNVTHLRGDRRYMWIKWMPLRYFLTFIIAIICPPIAYCLAIVLSPFAFLFAILCYIPIYIVGYFQLRCRNCFSELCKVSFVFLFCLPLAIVLSSIVYIVGGICILIVASILLPLYYPLIIILILRMLFRHCSIIPKSQ